MFFTDLIEGKTSTTTAENGKKLMSLDAKLAVFTWF